MHRRSLAVPGLVLALSSLLGACSESEYDACEDRATEEWSNYRQDLIDAGGGDDDSLKDMYLEMEGYVIDQCGLESDQH